MLIAFVLFWILLIWGLKEGDLYAKEGAILVFLWLVFLVGLVYFPPGQIICIIGSVILDVVLLMKVLGQDIRVG